MKLYDSLTKEKTEFKTINNDGIVKMYSCGPTVYYYAHIGNMRAYLFMDTLKRVLEYNHYKVINVMNITDVGHLTSDEDEGEDKMSVSAQKEHKSVYDIADFYTNAFLKDLERLNIKKPTYIVKATDHIKEMIDFIKTLEQKGYTYIISDGVYFDVSKYADYGKLSNMSLEDKLSGARVEINEEKRNPQDFALWKFVEPNHIMKWESPWGLGCPGWHIECSAMAKKYLGDYFDIHTGGIDHLTVHHENEIAQNNCALGHKVVNRWMHCEFLQVDGGKMSKSLNNCYTIQDLIDKGYSPLDFRYFSLQTSYRKKLNFTFEALQASKIALSRLRTLVNSHKNVKRELNSKEILSLSLYMDKFAEAINDDLNTSSALGIMWDMLKEMPLSEDVYNSAIRMDYVFGLDLDKEIEVKTNDSSIPDEILQLAKERNEAKKNKDYTKADKLREQIKEQGYAIIDNTNGYELKKI